MATPNMRASQNRQEHLENIGFVFVDESNAFVWQNFKGTKLIAPIIIKNIVLERDCLVLSPVEGIFPDFQQGKDLYFKADHKEMVFKSSPKQYQITPKKIEITFPEKVFYLEHRAITRISSDPKQEILINLRPSEIKREGKIFTCRVRNISSNGIGIVAEQDYQEFFSIDSLFSITGFNGTEFEEGLIAKTIYNHTINIPKVNTLANIIGLKLETELPKEILNAFSGQMFNSPSSDTEEKA